MDTIIQKSLEKAVNYEAYRKLINHLAAGGQTTGINNDANITYTKLNDRRMKRWDKTLTIPKDIQKSIQKFSREMTWLIITESWSGNAAHVIPVINKIAQINKHIQLKFVLRDENPELMQAFLTHGKRAIPKIIMIDNKTGEVINEYGPRPSVANDYVNRFKSLYGNLTSSFIEDLQHWYNNDKGLTTLTDLTEILGQIESSVYQ